MGACNYLRDNLADRHRSIHEDSRSYHCLPNRQEGAELPIAVAMDPCGCSNRIAVLRRKPSILL